MEQAPLVSVIMPVYNGEKYLQEAIDSILNQTFGDFEFIIINDGSTDKTLEIIKSYSDPRIRVISQENKGIIHSLNKGISESRGKYIARMDADDISLPDRFKRQSDFLEANPEIGLLGTTFAIQIDKKIKCIAAVLLQDSDLRRQLLYKCPFGHGTVMFRKNLETGLNGLWYSPSEKHVEDYELWSRIALITKVANLPGVLYIWRDNPFGISSSKRAIQRKNTLKIVRRNQSNLRLHTIEQFNVPFISAYENKEMEIFGHPYAVRRINTYAIMQLQLSRIAARRAQVLLAFKLLFKGFLLILTNTRHDND